MIKLIKSTFYKEKQTKKELNKFINTSAILSFSSQCEKFEKSFSVWQKRKYCIFLNSGSSANLAIIQSLLNLKKLKTGDKAGFSSLTWSTNVMPLIQLGLQAIPIDVEKETLNVSSRTLANTLKKHKIKMLFLTNLLGFCSDLEQIQKVCRENDIILIEDNCESLGSIYKGKKLGNFGLASTFSFYVGHHLSTIEGGMVATDNESLAEMLQLVRAHGWDRNLSLNKQNKLRTRFKVNSTFYSRYTFYDLGYNLRPTEISGFIGNMQMKHLNEIVAKRQANFVTFAQALYKNPKYYAIQYNHLNLISNFAVPIICKSKKIRDEIVEKCSGKIELRPIVGGDMSTQPFYVKHMAKFVSQNNATNARLIHDQGLYFGNNPELTQKEIDYIIRVFK